MDARTKKHEVEREEEARLIAEASAAKRDRLLASFNLIAGIGLVVALPFALREGAEFFMPVTAALVVAIALVPMLEWFERRGVPSRIAAGLCLIVFLLIEPMGLGKLYANVRNYLLVWPFGYARK